MKILVVEDEFILAEELTETLESEGYEVTFVIDNGPEALEYFKENEIDLIICDININGPWDGIDTIKKLNEVRSVPFIFLTAFTDSETIERAKATFPSAYIPKPYHITNLRMAIEMAINNFAVRIVPLKTTNGNDQRNLKEAILQINDDIFIKQNYQYVKFPLNDILFLQADDTHTNIQTSTKKYTIRQSLLNTLDRLSLNKLVRVHRSYAVNINKIDSFNEFELTIGTHIVPMSRSFKDEFMQNFLFR